MTGPTQADRSHRRYARCSLLTRNSAGRRQRRYATAIAYALAWRVPATRHHEAVREAAERFSLGDPVDRRLPRSPTGGLGVTRCAPAGPRRCPGAKRARCSARSPSGSLRRRVIAARGGRLARLGVEIAREPRLHLPFSSMSLTSSPSATFTPNARIDRLAAGRGFLSACRQRVGRRPPRSTPPASG